jgi:class 3 adenylate cyclase/predicted alpha/beta hydrolase
LTGSVEPREPIVVDRPETRYARSGDVHIAYQVFGDGPIDLVFIPGAFSHVEIAWENPKIAHAFERFARFARVIIFDKRGTGLSDRVGVSLTYENFLDDLLVVLDACGCERAAFYGQIDGAMIATVFAATYPERSRALVTFGMPARPMRSDDYPWGMDPAFWDAARHELDDAAVADLLLSTSDPANFADPEIRRWTERWFRASIGPGGLLALIDAFVQTDIRDVLPTVRVPTLVMHVSDDGFVPVENARFVADHIAGAQLRVVSSGGTSRSLDDDVLDEVESFITGAPPVPHTDRVLATVLFSDIVGSTQRASEVGDRAWRERLDRVEAVVRRELDRFQGKFVKDTGDGYLATFDGPARAINCARTVRDSLLALEIETRTGLHTGEVERRGVDVAGIGVHLAARIMDAAETGEILVSSTVKDLVVGSGIRFSERGEREFKGVPDRWRLFSVDV